MSILHARAMLRIHKSKIAINLTQPKVLAICTPYMLHVLNMKSAMLAV